MVLCKFDETFLREIRMMLDLKRRWDDLRIAEEIQDELTVEIADSNTLCQALVDETFHCRPCFLDTSLTRHHVLPIVGKAGRISVLGIDVFE